MITKLENLLRNTRLTPLTWVAGISGILMVRFFLEALSSPTSSGIIASDASTLIHYYLFFIGVALSTMIFLWSALPSWRKILPQFVSLAFLMILVAPIVDFIISGGHGFTMAYLFDTPKQMLYSFLTFFGPNWHQGITIGIRVELALILILTGFLIYQIRKNLLKTFGFVLILYAIVFAFGSLPGLISLGHIQILTFFSQSIIASATFTDNLHSTLLYTSAQRALEIGFNFLMAKILFLICLALTSIWFYLSEKVKFLSVIKNSRPERILAYFSVIFFGMFLSHLVSPAIVFSWNDYISILVLLISFYLSWMFAVCTNDIADEDIDKISNQTRPLIQGEVSTGDLKQASYLFITASLIAGYLSGFYAFFSILAFTALYYIYSMPPTRFKQIPIFSSFLISLCKLTCAVSGFFLFSSSKVLHTFPTEAIIGIIVFFTLFVSIRDLKDIEGDTALGIATTPVLFNKIFGSPWGKIAVGLMVALSYLLIPLFTHIHLFWFLSIPAAFLSYYFCLKSNYRELPLFLIYFSYFLISILVLRLVF